MMIEEMEIQYLNGMMVVNLNVNGQTIKLLTKNNILYDLLFIYIIFEKLNKNGHIIIVTLIS